MARVERNAKHLAYPEKEVPGRKEGVVRRRDLIE